MSKNETPVPSAPASALPSPPPAPTTRPTNRGTVGLSPALETIIEAVTHTISLLNKISEKLRALKELRVKQHQAEQRLNSERVKIEALEARIIILEHKLQKKRNKTPADPSDVFMQPDLDLLSKIKIRWVYITLAIMSFMCMLNLALLFFTR